MITLIFPKGSTLIKEEGNELHIDVFAPTDRDKEQIINMINNDPTYLKNIRGEVLLDEIKRRYDPSDLIDCDIDWSW